MRYCKYCVMPDTRPQTPFNEEGICPACVQFKARTSIDWQAREEEFRALVKTYKTTSGYDCVIPVSGGKDSTYQVYKVKEYGLNPLCVCFETTLQTEIGRENLNAMRSIGVDLFHIRSNPNVMKALTYKGFKYLGNAQWPLFLGAYVAPIQVAVRFNIPLVIWGENPQAEYGGEKKDAVKNELDKNWVYNLGGLNDKAARDMLDTMITENDLVLYQYPDDGAVRRIGLKSVFLGYYFPWNQRKQIDIVSKIGWHSRISQSEGTYTNYNGIDCDALPIHVYLKYVKFGYGRATDDACLDLRNGRITREQAVRLVQRYDGRIPYVARKRFIEYLGISLEEYESVIDNFTNKDIFETDSTGRFLRDIDGCLIKKQECRLV